MALSDSEKSTCYGSNEFPEFSVEFGYTYNEHDCDSHNWYFYLLFVLKMVVLSILRQLVRSYIANERRMHIIWIIIILWTYSFGSFRVTFILYYSWRILGSLVYHGASSSSFCGVRSVSGQHLGLFDTLFFIIYVKRPFNNANSLWRYEFLTFWDVIVKNYKCPNFHMMNHGPWIIVYDHCLTSLGNSRTDFLGYIPM